jgi:DNA-nicking Smr family endonuclease
MSDDVEDPKAADTVEQVPVDGTLDLHMFQPRDTKDLLNDYLDECLERGITRARIVHGKGVGVQREIVHSVLRSRADVIEFGLGNESSGSWGATWVVLRSEEDA